MTDIPLRRATPGDLDAVTALQRAAYAKNRPILGVEPLPLQADYAEILASMEVWLAEPGGPLEGVLILEPHPDHMLIWSIATDPAKPPSGVGRALLLAAEAKARERGLSTLCLYTGTRLTERVAWYARHGYVVDHIQEMPDRSVTHMVKVLAESP